MNQQNPHNIILNIMTTAMHCEEKPNGSWTCKEYKKDGTFKREKEYPTVIYKQRGTKDWINYLLPVLKVFGL